MHLAENNEHLFSVENNHVSEDLLSQLNKAVCVNTCLSNVKLLWM